MKNVLFEKLWNEWHFVEYKTEIMNHVFKILQI